MLSRLSSIPLNYIFISLSCHSPCCCLPVLLSYGTMTYKGQCCHRAKVISHSTCITGQRWRSLLLLLSLLGLWLDVSSETVRIAITLAELHSSAVMITLNNPNYYGLCRPGQQSAMVAKKGNREWGLLNPLCVIVLFELKCSNNIIWFWYHSISFCPCQLLTLIAVVKQSFVLPWGDLFFQNWPVNIMLSFYACMLNSWVGMLPCCYECQLSCWFLKMGSWL